MNKIRKLRLIAREYGYLKSHMPTSIIHALGGDTIEEALANIAEAIQGCLDARRELGMPETLEMNLIKV